MANIRVVSWAAEQFVDRGDAGRILAEELKEWRGFNPVVVGIPRGGIYVAKEMARLLEGDLDVVLTHKIGAPGDPEVAIGAVTESGRVFVDRSEEFSGHRAYVKEEAARQLVVLKRRVEGYRKILPETKLKGRVVIVADDGVATGFTMQAALWAAGQEHPKKLIAAIPVAPERTLKNLAKYADETVCLKVSDSFMSVGQFYMNFDAVQDSNVLQTLEHEAIRRSHAVSHYRGL